jgi:WD40 repeat protein
LQLSADGEMLAVAAGSTVLLARVADVLPGAVEGASSVSTAALAPQVLRALHPPPSSSSPSTPPVDGLLFTSRGELVVAANGGLRVYDARDLRRALHGGSGGADDAGRGRSGSTGGSASEQTGRVYCYKGGPVATVVSPDGRWAASGCNDDTVQIWEIGRGNRGRGAGGSRAADKRDDESLTCSGYAATPAELAWSDCGQFLATGGGATVTVWECAGVRGSPAGSRPIICPPVRPCDVTALAFRPGTALLASGTEAGVVALTEINAPAAETVRLRGARAPRSKLLRPPAAVCVPPFQVDDREEVEESGDDDDEGEAAADEAGAADKTTGVAEEPALEEGQKRVTVLQWLPGGGGLLVGYASGHVAVFDRVS